MEQKNQQPKQSPQQLEHVPVLDENVKQQLYAYLLDHQAEKEPLPLAEMFEGDEKKARQKFEYFRENYKLEYQAALDDIARGRMNETERVDLARKESEDELRAKGILPAA